MIPSLEKMLLCDIDGVLLNWADGFNDWIHDYKHPADQDKNFIKDNVKDNTYCIAERYGIPLDTITYYIKMFNESNSFSSLKPLDKTVPHFVHNLNHAGWKIQTVSSYSETVNARIARIENLNKYFPTSIHHQIGLDKSKLELLKHLKTDTQREMVFIDDKPDNVQDGIDAGIETFLLLTSYNKTDKLANTHGRTWPEIYTNLIQRVL